MKEGLVWQSTDSCRLVRNKAEEGWVDPTSGISCGGSLPHSLLSTETQSNKPVQTSAHGGSSSQPFAKYVRGASQCSLGVSRLHNRSSSLVDGLEREATVDRWDVKKDGRFRIATRR